VSPVEDWAKRSMISARPPSSTSAAAPPHKTPRVSGAPLKRAAVAGKRPQTYLWLSRLLLDSIASVHAAAARVKATLSLPPVSSCDIRQEEAGSAQSINDWLSQCRSTHCLYSGHPQLCQLQHRCCFWRCYRRLPRQ
jgi:hypothetical protein